MSTNRAGRNESNGYTLMELAIVLAIVASLAAIAWPVLMRPLGRSRVQQAGQDVRRALSEARQSAVEDGKTYQFRYQPGTPRFEVAAVDSIESTDPVSTPEISLNEATTPPPFASPLPGVNYAAQEPPIREDGFGDSLEFADYGASTYASSERSAVAGREELHDGVVFANPEPDTPSSVSLEDSDPLEEDVTWEATDATASADWETDVAPDYAAESPLEDDPSWSEPIYFHPDGRTSTARVVLEGEEGDTVEVTLRGLTGAARVGRLHRRSTPISRETVSDGAPTEMFR